MLVQAVALVLVALPTPSPSGRRPQCSSAPGPPWSTQRCSPQSATSPTPDWRARSVGVYRLWRDGGFAVGALAAGLLADAFAMQAGHRERPRARAGPTDAGRSADPRGSGVAAGIPPRALLRRRGMAPRVALDHGSRPVAAAAAVRSRRWCGRRSRPVTWPTRWPVAGIGCRTGRSRGCCARRGSACRPTPMSPSATSTSAGTPSSATSAPLSSSTRSGRRWTVWTPRRRN